MDVEDARRQARELFGPVGQPSDCELVEVGRNVGGGDFLAQIKAETPEGFSLPGLLLFGLTDLLGLRSAKPWEKVRWSVCFSLRGATFGFELRKFGLRMLCEPASEDLPITREILGKARALVNIVKRYLSGSFGSEQIDAGNFTIHNLYNLLDGRYRFIRSEAERAYAAPELYPTHGVGPNGLTWTGYDPFKAQREGDALATAAVDAYFSRLEHFFCLAAGFPESQLPPGGIREFLMSNWSSKAKAILDLQDNATKKLYDRLLRVRDEWRNPIAHGGFLKAGGSLCFHLPGIGAIPLRLEATRFGAILGFNLGSSSFDELAQLFDSFDALLLGTHRYALRWAEAGLDVAFDAVSRARFSSAVGSDEEFEALLEGTEAAYDRHVNMDY